jgi:negative regulator of sigma E activity
MTDPVKEQLSACLDGELPEAELDLLLKQVHRDSRLQQSVARYALIGEVLRTGSSPIPSADFASRISQAIAAEGDDMPVQTAPEPVRREIPRWVRPVGGAAIAAGVAAVAVMVLLPQLDSEPPAGGTQIVANTPPPAPSYIVPSAAPQVVPAAHLAKYVMAHSEYTGPLGRRTAWSSVLSDDESEIGDVIDLEAAPSEAELPADPTLQAADPTPQSQP